VPLAGCISLDITWDSQLECAAVGGNVCLAADLCARLSLRSLTHLDRGVTIDGYAKVISL
jgi:hypothetical protein